MSFSSPSFDSYGAFRARVAPSRKPASLERVRAFVLLMNALSLMI
jgi:hypothetical protein